MENEVYSDLISLSHFMFIFVDHYSFRNTKNHYYTLAQLKTIFETMIPAITEFFNPFYLKSFKNNTTQEKRSIFGSKRSFPF